MPNNYELTVQKLENSFSDDQICSILKSGNSTIANKKILDCLIEKMNCREELLDLCVQLENISTSHDLKIVLNKIRSGLQCICNIIYNLHTYVSCNYAMAVCTVNGHTTHSVTI